MRSRILHAIGETMREPQVAARFADNAFDVIASAPEVFLARARKDSEVMADLVARKIVGVD